mgnify:CR=1 FL=1
MKIGQNFVSDNWNGTHIRFGDYKLGEIVVDMDKFDEIEKLVKDDHMCLVDIHIFNELEETIEGLKEQNELYKGWIDVYKNQ